MLVVQICVGSSCHLKGSQDIIELFESALAENKIESDEVVLTGSFCIGKCNRVGVTVQINDDVHVGVTRENFKEFFAEHVLGPVLEGR
ncbi:MAG: NAD(P)H-dependent oxidoreductase subunit E [Bacteroidaceae bacterium]|nr:NAD(P)H-dependent oxidoreductase subunit E [Bacteroidaceae bacterium]